MGEESPKPASSTPTGAVFLSYASQDAEAAQKICEALRAAGIEVWFDQSELRGGDAWDRKIRDQIRHCSLFIPVISAHSQARLEGYFRREWKFAVERKRDIADELVFLLPVVIDETPERGASVPEGFHEVQWTRLPGGAASQGFIQHVSRLLTGHQDQPKPAVKALQPSLAPAPTRPAAQSKPNSPRQIWLLLAGGAAVIIVGYIGIDRYVSHKGSQASAAPASAASADSSIAVLPLANESGEASQQYFSDGISEDLITALSQLPGLKVIGRSSSFQFRDSKEDSRSIGAKLGVAHLLEGSVRRSGDVVRVSAELINTADGSAQWSERYDRPYKDLFALQDEITRAVAGALRTKLLQGEHAAQSERPSGGSLEAYNALLQGRFYSLRNTESDWRKAIEYYSQATHVDPSYGIAWSELAQGWTTLSNGFLEGAPAQDAFAKAREAARRALAVSPELAAAHLAWGYVLQSADFDWRGAEAEFRRAIELAPNDAEAKYFLGSQLATLGEVEAAIELTRQALATEPLRASWYNWLGNYLLGLNRLDEAERAVRTAIDLQPGAVWYHQTLTAIQVQRGNAPGALAAAQQEPEGVWRDYALVLARQIGTDRGAAEAALRTMIDRDANISAYQIAQAYALRNDAKATFEWLERAWSNRDTGIGFLLYDPFILHYKDDPRFAAFCRKVGLPTPAEVKGET
jgi:TolB-like protein/Flp pilus assembly protein TadD